MGRVQRSICASVTTASHIAVMILLNRERFSFNLIMTYDEPFYNLYSLARLTGTRKSTRATWAGHVGSMEEIRSVYRIFITYLNSTNHVEDLHGRIILKQIINMVQE